MDERRRDTRRMTGAHACVHTRRTNYLSSLNVHARTNTQSRLYTRTIPVLLSVLILSFSFLAFDPSGLSTPVMWRHQHTHIRVHMSIFLCKYADTHLRAYTHVFSVQPTNVSARAQKRPYVRLFACLLSTKWERIWKTQTN